MTVDPQVEFALGQLRAHKATGKSVDESVSEVRNWMNSMGVGVAAMDALDRAAALFREEFKRHDVLHPNTVVEPHEPWYTGSPEGACHWPALKAFLRDTVGRDENILGEVDRTSDEVVSMLGNPHSRKSFTRRGLVIGYVQSGKTENMTAVMAKAVDAGYNMVIVLAGLTEKLRQQTQARFDRDLVSHHPGKWRKHTSSVAGEDFSIPRSHSFDVHDRVVHLLVLKKTTLRGMQPGEFRGPLGKLEQTLRNTPPHMLKKFRALIIDDECDQATVNSAAGDMDVSVINDCIRRVLQHLPFHTYVGYTATPFANVLINPWPDDRARMNGEQIDDLYPKSFITALPRPDAYFGAERLFGASQEEDAESSSSGYPYICDISPADEEMLQPPSRRQREDFWPQIPESLENAILYFLGACAIRMSRGQADKHMTMLVHTSVYKEMHTRVSSMIEDWTAQRRQALLKPTSDISRRMIDLVSSEYESMRSLRDGDVEFDTGIIHRHLSEVLEGLEFVIENGDSDDRMDYSGAPKRYIVTGGSILARGLTLDGLTVSYFLRSSSQFDTLLQMGRWFGYRVGYEDLPRIWTTPDLQEKFGELADVESHIRRDIERYQIEEITPLEMAVRIPLIPGMAITGAAKMKHAVKARVSYFGREEQTTRFYHKDQEKVDNNWDAGAELIQAMNALSARDVSMDRLVWRQVPLTTIRRFIRRYRPHDVQKTLNPDLLESFLNGAEKSNELLAWNVAIVENRRNPMATSATLGSENIRLLNRSKMRPGSSESAWLKALLSARDCLLDVPEADLPKPLPSSWSEIRDLRSNIQSGVPLLLLYPVDAASKAGDQTSGTRQDLDAVGHLLGYGIVFPKSSVKEPDLVEVDVQPPLAEEMDEVIEDEMQMASHAGSVIADDD